MSKKTILGPPRDLTEYTLETMEDKNLALYVNNVQATCIKRSPFPTNNALGQTFLNVPGCGSHCQFFHMMETERHLDETETVKTKDISVEISCCGYLKIKIKEVKPFNRFKK